MGLFSFIQKAVMPDPQPVEEQDREFKKEVYPVRGAHYFTENIMKLAVRNEEWQATKETLKSKCGLPARVFRYNFINKPVKLVPDPKNKHDKNAVMVIIAGEQVGYIPAESAVHVKDIIENHSVKYISSFISGGDYKVVAENDTTKLHDDVSIKVSIGYV